MWDDLHGWSISWNKLLWCHHFVFTIPRGTVRPTPGPIFALFNNLLVLRSIATVEERQKPNSNEPKQNWTSWQSLLKSQWINPPQLHKLYNWWKTALSCRSKYHGHGLGLLKQFGWKRILSWWESRCVKQFGWVNLDGRRSSESGFAASSKIVVRLVIENTHAWFLEGCLRFDFT